MCGIVGVCANGSVRDRRWLAAGRDAMAHRGPDDYGEWWSQDGRVGLGHRRLSIIDLSPLGHQPMADAHGALHIVFNGEIYNFRELRAELAARGHSFRSGSDTEVLLEAYRAWGTDCVRRLNGMFAFALFDATRKQLFMARDRAGEKPLFYSFDGGSLRFASELKALLQDPSVSRSVDPEALDCYLSMGFVPGDMCMLRGVRKLPPAHALSFDAETAQLRVWRYWSLPQEQSEASRTAVDEHMLLDELQTLLEDAVRRQLVADVPVGVLLSGGVDSSLVTALAARAAGGIKTFTIRFPGFGVYDETEHARLIANHFGTQHTELEAGETSVELMPLLARQFDEPMVDSSMIPTYMVSRLVREHCKVALGGDGGDELFAGYTHYRRMLWMERRLRLMPRRLAAMIGAVGSTLVPIGVRGRNWLQALAVDPQCGVPAVGACFDAGVRAHLMASYGGWSPTAENVRAVRLSRASGLLQRATRLDFENYLAEDILVKVDRASMLSSLEVRAPLLDYRVIEFAFGMVPPQMRATTTGCKILLKKLAARLLPAEFDLRRKQGFSLPLNSWLRKGPWLDFFRNVLLANHAGTFDRKTVQSLLAGQAKGRNNAERLFALVLFELWRREYRVSL
jgi:asparagine synthase (glutamine-hydrolysing)